MDGKTSPGPPSSATVERCFKCFVEFGWFKRKHTCRRCTRLFCDACSSNRIALQPGKEPCRVCDYCALEVFGAISKFPITAAPVSRTATAPAATFASMSSGNNHSSILKLSQSPESSIGRSPSPIMSSSSSSSAVASPVPLASVPAPSLSTLLSATSISILGDLSPLQSASRIPDDLVQQVQTIGFDRPALTQLLHSLSRQGVQGDELLVILRSFFTLWKPPAPQAGVHANVSDSMLEEMEASEAQSSSTTTAHDEQALEHLRAQLAEANAKLREVQKDNEDLSKQMKEVETQVLGGFSFNTWKRVQQMAADQAREVECVVCLDEVASTVTSCGCKCLCGNCYRSLPTKANGFKSCPNCSKPIR